MRLFYLCFLSLFLGLSFNTVAQNDDCSNAVEFNNLNNECVVAAFNLPTTYDVVNGNCADPFDAPNLWYKFTAQGEEVTINSEGLPSGAEIALGQFVGGDCVNGNWTGLACEENLLEFNNLVVGEEYFIILTQVDQTEDIRAEICVDNPTVNPPPNDLACDAETITPDGSCVVGTTTDATIDFASAPGCPSENLESMVWYEVTISPGNNSLNVTMTGYANGSVGLVELPNGCNDIGTNVLLGISCSVPYEFDAPVVEGNTYYIFVGSTEENEGTFELCATESGPPPGCAESDDCANADQNTIDTPTANGDPECITDCNLGSTPTNINFPCFDINYTTTYYEFTTDANTSRVTIELQDLEGSMDNVAVALLENCNTVIRCEAGNNGEVNIANAIVAPNTTYILVVATPESGQSEEFELCVSGFQISDDYCVSRDNSADSSLSRIQVIGTSLGSPPGGPYIPGEEVTFEIYIPDYSLTSTIQWLQAIIPVFGNGWAPSSFSGPNSTGEPVVSNGPNSAGGATWNWYAENANDYNDDAAFYSLYQDDLNKLAICYFTEPNCPTGGISLGDGMPAGWYAYSNGSSTGCLPNGDPDFGWGDGQSGSWTVTFTLQAREYSGPEGCNETGFTDCSVRFYTFSDQQIGCWDLNVNGNACAGDEYKAHYAVNKCCIGPELIPEDITICSGEQTAIELMSDVSGTEDVTYTWTVSAPPSVTGASDGSGQFINQTLVNSSGTPQEVIYTVTPTIEASACPGTPGEIVVTVLPEIEADAGPDIDGCAQGEFTLGGAPTAIGGGGNVTYEWNNGAGNESNPTVTVNSTTTFIVTVTDEYGCEATDEVVVEVSEAIVIEITGDSIYCQEDQFTTLTAEALTSTPPYQYEWGGPTTSNGQTIDATEGTYVVTVTDDNGCTGTQEYVVEEKATPSFDFVLSPDTDTICEGDFVDILAIPFSDGTQFTYDWELPFGSSQDEVISASNDGYYTLTVSDEFGCSVTDSIRITVIPYPEVTIIGDSVICAESSGTLSTSESFNSYLWSTGDETPTTEVDAAGTYTVTVTNAGGCESTDEIQVEIDNSASADAGGDRLLTCDSTSVRLDGSGSTSGNEFNFSWMASNGGNIISGMNSLVPVVNATGTYTLTVENSETGCVSTDEVTVAIDTMPPVVDAGVTQTLTCATTTIELDGSNSDYGADYTILWTTSNGNIISGENTINPTVDQPGVYTLTIEDETNGCIASDEVTINIDDSRPNANAGDDFVLTCNQDSYTPNTTGSSTGSQFSYQWTSPDGGVIQSGATTLDPVLTAMGTYVLEITNTDNNCAVRDSLSIDEDFQEPEVSGPDAYTINCYSPDTVIYVVVNNGSGNYQFDWSLADGTDQFDTDSTLLVDEPGMYTVTVTDLENGCTAELEVDIDEDTTTPNSDAGADIVLDCNTTTQQLDGSNSSQGGNFEYLWTTTDGNIASGETTLTPTIDTDGTYTLRIRNIVNGCISTDNVVVTKSEDLPDADAGGPREITCDSTSIRLLGSASTSTGNSLSFSWTTNGGNFISGQNTLTPVVDQPGEYILTVIDDVNGCEATSTITVSLNNDDPEIISPYDQILNCTITELEIDATGSASGSDISYNWTTIDGNIVGSNNGITITVNQAGTYTLTITNEETGCVSSEDFTISLDTNYPIADIQDPETITCAQDIITLDGTASSSGSDFSYNWTTTDGNILTDETQNTIDVDEAGTYRLIVLNSSNGCTDTSEVEVNINQDIPSISGLDDVTLDCKNETVEVSFASNIATSMADINWETSDGAIIDGRTDTLNIVISAGGTITVTITDLSNGCSNSAEIIVTEDFDAPIAESGDDQVLTCNQQELTLDGTGSSQGSEFTYSWTSNNGGNIVSGGNTLNPTVDVSATYILEVVNTRNGCSSVDSMVVGIDENLPQIIIFPPDTINCINETIEIDASRSPDGDDYTIMWETTDGSIVSGENSLLLEVSSGGTYTLTIRDDRNSCEATAQVTVVEDVRTPELNIVNPGPFSCLVDELDVNVTIENTDGNNLIEWSTSDGEIISGSNSETIVVGSSGTYTVTVTNLNNGCEESIEVVINPDEETPVANAGEDKTLDCSNTEIILDGSQSSQGNEFEVTWTTNNGNIVSGINDLNPVINQSGTYILEVVNNNNGCIDRDEVMVDIDTQSVDIKLSQDGPLTCSKDVVIITTELTGSNSYSFNWSASPNGSIISGDEVESIEVNSAGVYTIEVINELNSCVSEASITVEDNIDTIRSADFIIDQPNCFGDTRGCLIVEDINGGEAPYTYMVDGVDFGITTRICDLGIGMHSLTITDVNGCTFITEFEIVEPSDYSVSIGNSVRIEEGDSLLLELTTNLPDSIISEIIWYAPDFTECELCYELGIQPEKTSLVRIEVIDINGCIYEDVMHVAVEKPRRVYVPTGFSPNDDGNNDWITVFGGPEVEEVKSFVVYDRWGEKVFENYNFEPNIETSGWNGFYKNKIMQPGVYIYQYEVEFDDGLLQSESGDFTLLR